MFPRTWRQQANSITRIDFTHLFAWNRLKGNSCLCGLCSAISELLNGYVSSLIYWSISGEWTFFISYVNCCFVSKHESNEGREISIGIYGRRVDTVIIRFSVRHCNSPVWRENKLCKILRMVCDFRALYACQFQLHELSLPGYWIQIRFYLFQNFDF